MRCPRCSVALQPIVEDRFEDVDDIFAEYDPLTDVPPERVARRPRELPSSFPIPCTSGSVCPLPPFGRKAPMSARSVSSTVYTQFISEDEAEDADMCAADDEFDYDVFGHGFSLG